MDNFVDEKIEVWRRYKLPNAEEAERCAEIYKTYGFQALQDHLSDLLDEDLTDCQYLTETEKQCTQGRVLEIYGNDKCLVEAN